MRSACLNSQLFKFQSNSFVSVLRQRLFLTVFTCQNVNIKKTTPQINGLTSMQNTWKQQRLIFKRHEIFLTPPINRVNLFYFLTAVCQISQVHYPKKSLSMKRERCTSDYSNFLLKLGTDLHTVLTVYLCIASYLRIWTGDQCQRTFVVNMSCNLKRQWPIGCSQYFPNTYRILK